MLLCLFFISMIWLTITVFLYNSWPRICSVCRNHNSVLSSLVIYLRVCKNSRTTGTTYGPETAYPSGALEFIPHFSGVHVARSVIFYEVFCTSMFSPFVPFLFAITLSVLLRFTTFDYPFGILKLFLNFQNDLHGQG